MPQGRLILPRGERLRHSLLYSTPAQGDPAILYDHGNTQYVITSCRTMKGGPSELCLFAHRI